MSDITTRVLTDAKERADVVRYLGGYAFSSTPPLPTDWDKWFEHMGDATIIAKFDGDKPVAQVADHPMTQNVRGKLYPMNGIWGVVTMPGYRRQGFVRELMTDLLKAARDAGNPFTTLYPFRASFYNRMGYVTFPQYRPLKFDPRELHAVTKMALQGHIELKLLADGWDEYRDFMKRYQQQTHGLAIKDEAAMENERTANKWLTLAYVDGEVCGCMHYVNKGNEEDMVMHARNFYTLNNEARYVLLDWFARHTDQIREVQLQLSPADKFETWLPDMSTIKVDPAWPPMGRVLDVAKIGGMEVGNGELTLKVSDPMCPWNEGVWTFASEGGELVVTPGGDVDCDATIQALSALVYGTHDPEVFPFRGWSEPSAEVAAKMVALFPPMQPYLHEQF